MINNVIKLTLLLILCLSTQNLVAQVKVTPDGGTPLPPGYKEKIKESAELKKAGEKVASGRKLMKEAQKLMTKAYDDLNTDLINEASVLYLNAETDIQLGLSFYKNFYLHNGLPFNTAHERDLLHLIDRCEKNRQRSTRYMDEIENRKKGVTNLLLIPQNVVTTNVSGTPKNDKDFWVAGDTDRPKELIRFSKNNLWGYKDPESKIIIKERFLSSSDFTFGKAIVTDSHRDFGIINDKGQYLIKPSKGIEYSNIYKNTCIAKDIESGKMALFSTTGKNLTGFIYSYIHPFNNKVAKTSLLDKERSKEKVYYPLTIGIYTYSYENIINIKGEKTGSDIYHLKVSERNLSQNRYLQLKKEMKGIPVSEIQSAYRSEKRVARNKMNAEIEKKKQEILRNGGSFTNYK